MRFVPLLVLMAALVVGAALAGSGASGQAGVLYVGGDGCNDARSAAEATSASTPWCSIARAIAAAPSGSTVLVRGGSYPRVQLSGDGHRSAMVSFRPAAGESAVVDGMDIKASSFLRFEGFRLSGDVDLGTGTQHVQVVGNDLPATHIMLTGVGDVLIEGNHVHDLPANMTTCSCGIRAVKDFGAGVPVTDLVIRANLIENLSNDPIQVNKGQNVLVEGNVVRNAYPAGNGEHTDGVQAIGTDDLTIRGNDFRHLAAGLMFTDSESQRVTIENNLIADTNGVGLKTHWDGAASEMPGLKVLNNTFADTGYGAQFRGAHRDSVVRNNIFDGVIGLNDQAVVDHNLIARPSPGTTAGDYGQAAILAKPGFTGDFELAATSPAVDAGSSIDVPTTDRLGRPRRDDPGAPNRGVGPISFVDLGADERQAGADAGSGGGPGSTGGGAEGNAPSQKGSGGGVSRLAFSVPARLRLEVVRRHGILVTLRVPAGARQLRLYVSRLRAGRPSRVVARRTVSVRRSGRLSVRIRVRRAGLRAGTYVVGAQVTRPRDFDGTVVRHRLRLVR